MLLPPSLTTSWTLTPEYGALAGATLYATTAGQVEGDVELGDDVAW